MLRVAPAKIKAKSSEVKASDEGKVLSFHSKRTRFAGLVADAKRLGVHRNHLYLVLSGRRQSRRLMARYKALRKGAR